MTRTFNINEDVLVRLTARGMSILRARHAVLANYATLPPFAEPICDAEGFARFQLHDLMFTFGAHVGFGTTVLPFETEIRIPHDTTGTDAWQPIDTAPHDWTDIILFDPDYPNDFHKSFEGYHDDDLDIWRDRQGIQVQPTHWQHLPKPPADKETPAPARAKRAIKLDGIRDPGDDDLREYGYAAGNLVNNCWQCGARFEGDRDAVNCKRCASLLFCGAAP